MWHKFDMIERLILQEQHDWIWWIDFDTLSTNMSIPVYEVIKESLSDLSNPEDVDFLLTEDWYCLSDLESSIAELTIR